MYKFGKKTRQIDELQAKFILHDGFNTCNVLMCFYPNHLTSLTAWGCVDLVGPISVPDLDVCVELNFD